MPNYRIVDYVQCDLGGIQKERVQRFIQDSTEFANNSTGASHPAPLLVAKVAATHAGLVTRNQAFYMPDRVRAGLPSFVTPYPKPVQRHHNDREDPIGRVRAYNYTDISNRYLEPMRTFKEYFGGSTFLDSKVDTERGFDQVRWVIKNLAMHDDYRGLGFGELDLYITDKDAAEKILDERYLTVSVGFDCTEIYCSHCHQEWADEGPCEHQPGTMVDGWPVVLIPGNHIYDEVSYVNGPADIYAQTLSVVQIESLEDKTVLSESPKVTDFSYTPILFGVSGGGIYRIDSNTEVGEQRAQEIINVSKDNMSKPTEASTKPETVLIDGVEFPADVTSIEDAKRENWLTDEIDGHKHRIIIDPATGNGFTSWDTDHHHDVVNKEVKPYTYREWDDETETMKETGTHTHTLTEKISPLEDTTEEPDIQDTTEEPADDAPLVYNDEAFAADDFYQKYFAPVLIELGFEDAVRTDEQLAELAAAQYCGPNARFPVIDHAHVLAARKILESYEGSGRADRWLAGLNRKARVDGFDQPAEVLLDNPVTIAFEDEGNTVELVVFTGQELLDRIGDLSRDAIERIRTRDDYSPDALYEAAEALGVGPAVRDTWEGMSELKPLEEGIAAYDQNPIDEKAIQTWVDMLALAEEEQRTALITTLLDRLVEKGLIPDYDKEFNDLVQENESLKSRIATLTAANRDMYSARQKFLADSIVSVRSLLGVTDYTELTDETRQQKIDELRVRSIDSLNDTLQDLIAEVLRTKDTSAGETDLNVEPSSTTPEPTATLNETHVVDQSVLQNLKDMPDGTARIFQALHQARKRRPTSPRS